MGPDGNLPAARPRTLHGWLDFGLLLAVFWAGLWVVCAWKGWPAP